MPYSLSTQKEQKPVRTFELTLAPGAPGGTGFYSKEILLPRRLQVTAIAVHPSGHLFAVGYVDGTIGFWSIEDEDKPLMLRTVDSPDGEDLSVVDTAQLETMMSSPQQHIAEPPREPIFKLSWSGFPNSSDPRGGDSVLTVLGGITLDSPACVTTLLLPPLHPPAPPAPTSPKGQNFPSTVHPEVRAAVCASLSPKNAHTYSAAGTVQDFLLFPRNNPHFSGSYDPTTILIISETDTPDVRISEAFAFPPPAFVGTAQTSPTETQVNVAHPLKEDPLEPDDALVDELELTLQSMSVSDDPCPARLPQCLWNASGEYLVKVDKQAYDTLVRDKLEHIDGEVPLPVKGGMAWLEDTEGHMKYTKQQPHRVLISHLRDLSVHFLDLTSQLLNSSGPESPLATNYPSPIPRLTIEIAPILLDPSLGLGDSTTYDPHLAQHHIDSICFAAESLECVTVMRNGAVILFRLDVPANATTFGQQALPEKELVSLSHLRVRRGLRYTPVFAIKPHKTRGQVTTCALSDVGFLAVAYASGLLLVIDLRGPRVLLRSESRPGTSSFLHRHSEVEPVHALTWACCGLSTDPPARMRLLCTTASGQTNIYTLEYVVPSTWKISTTPVTVEGSVQPLAAGSFVLDAKTGKSCRADRNGLATVLQQDRAETDKQYLWISAGTKGVRCMLNVNGERVAKLDWGHKVGNVIHVEIVGRLDSYVLVAYTTHGFALVYSLPHLEQIHTVLLKPEGFSEAPATDGTGDFLTHTAFPAPPGSSSRKVYSTELHTLFSARRVGPYAPPFVDLTHGRGPIPPQPQPVSLGPASVMSSVLGYLGSLSVTSAGDQIDALLAGPDRPIPQPASKPALPTGKSAAPSAGVPSAQSSVAATAAGMSSGVGDLYNRLGSALAERGEMLGDLQQSLNSLEEGSKGMVAQAKRLAAQQTAKGWFGF
ncbi:lethal giant larvae like, C-terminal-domain-containing protein [Daedaleopsis nitida]|nr:lethal giant larvae like, C-terminal-domain-containing protein [Daedaleopsis nitida]